MTKTIFNPDLHHRRSIRLKEYDYSQNGAYFVTICTYKKQCLFGEINNGEVQLNDTGIMVQKVWNELDKRYLNVETDEFVIMPNHIHGIIFFNVETDLSVCPNSNSPNKNGHPQRGAPTFSLSDVVQRFKSYTTTQYLHRVKQLDCHSFTGKLWHRNYYEHIIRNEKDLSEVREYIINNPINWELDSENQKIYLKSN